MGLKEVVDMPKFATKNKYRKGGYLKTMASVSKWLDGGNWIFWNHKPQHPSWIGSMQYRVINQAAERGILRRALVNDPRMDDPTGGNDNE